MDVRANGKISKVNAVPARQAVSRSYWLCQILGWTAVCAFNVSLSVFAAASVTAFVTIYGVTSLAGIALSHVWRGMLKRRAWLDGALPVPWAKLAAWVCFFGLMLLIVASAMFYVVRPAGMSTGFGWLPGATAFWILTFAAWTTLYGLVQSRRRASRLESERLRLDVLAKDAELRALQAQINPHFYFNSLNSLRALIYENPNAAAGMVDQLASLMRYMLTSGENKTVPLRAEIAAVRAYLAIEKIRFEDRLRPSFSIDAACDEQPIPPMALQTLVENAVKHGVERYPDGSAVEIAALREGHVVNVSVTNRGVLAGQPGTTRVGVLNTEKRLALLLGAEATLRLTENGGNVTATLLLPAT
jgi:Histidine kinase